ncbi:MAG: hypothetical protein H0X24_09980 [Ktedonobacterales bacterium]|nr:hypothetical protein [Ktedonobacterales bacterium]
MDLETYTALVQRWQPQMATPPMVAGWLVRIARQVPHLVRRLERARAGASLPIDRTEATLRRDLGYVLYLVTRLALAHGWTPAEVLDDCVARWQERRAVTAQDLAAARLAASKGA